MMTSVSVIIPNFNYAEFLPNAVESALNQSCIPLEVIVVDDGSKDNSLEVLEEFGDAVRVITQSNLGVSVARNVGASEARGDFLAFLDADDVWFPNKIDVQMARIQETGKMACQSGYRRFGEAFSESEDVFANSDPSVLLALLRQPSLSALSSTLLVERDLFFRLGSFDPRLSTSADFALGVRLLRQEVLCSVSRPLVKYRVHDRSMHGNAKAFRSDMRIILRESIPLELKRNRRQIFGAMEIQTMKTAALSKQSGVAAQALVRAAYFSPVRLAKELISYAQKSFRERH